MTHHNNWIDYEHGSYRIIDGELELMCTAWKPIIPSGVKVDYDKAGDFFIYSNPLDNDPNGLSYHYVLVPIKAPLTFSQISQAVALVELGYIEVEHFNCLMKS